MSSLSKGRRSAILRPAGAAFAWVFLACLAGGCPSGGDRSGPTAVAGPENPWLGASWQPRVSESFSKDDVRALQWSLAHGSFQALLAGYSCGDPLPTYDFTVSLWEPAPYQQRHVEIRERPRLVNSPENACLEAGFRFLLGLELSRFDPGGPMAGSRRPMAPSEEESLDALAARLADAAPICNCEDRFSGKGFVRHRSFHY